MDLEGAIGLAWSKGVKSLFDWGRVSGYSFSASSRNNNVQKLWMRPTIPWKLSCDRDIINRTDAAEIFSMRMDHLGFMDSIIVMSIIVTIVTLLPFCGSLFCGVNSRSRI